MPTVTGEAGSQTGDFPIASREELSGSVRLRRLDPGNIDDGGVESADVTGPLPYLYFEYRRLLSDKWRMVTGLGWLHVTIGDISGGQWIGRASFEYLIGKRWSVGGALNLANINVDWEGIDNDDGDNVLSGSFNMDVNDISLFGRVRW